MYNYIGQHPEDREMGWSAEVNGVCHDDDNWYFTQNGNLWKFPLKHDLNNTVKSADPLKGILKHETSFHLGDIDCYGDFIFVPVTGTGSIKGTISTDVLKTDRDRTAEMTKINLDKPQIFIFRKKDLAYVRSVRIKRSDNRDFDGMGWLAINPNNGLLYTSDHTVSSQISGDSAPIQVYSIGSVINDKEVLTFHSTLSLLDEYGHYLELSSMQGGCFDDKNYLHIMNGFVTNYKGRDPLKKKLDRYRTGLSIFKVLEHPLKGGNPKVYRLTHSRQDKGFRFQFDGWGDEPEGVTYWDLDRIPYDRRPKNINGQLHAIMLNNAGKKPDDFYFKHYRREPISYFYRVVIQIGNVDGAGTDAGVFVTLHGALGSSIEYELDDPNKDDFERGSRGVYIIEVNKNIGNLHHLTIRHNNKNKHAGMYVSTVSVTLLGDSEKTWNFPCNRWLAKDEDDKAISRVLAAQ